MTSSLRPGIITVSAIYTLLICGLGPLAIAYAQTPVPDTPLDTTHPRIVHKTQAEYSDQARLAKVSGTVVLQVSVTAEGAVSGGKVIRRIGFGLDEKAQQAVRQWRFLPAEKDGVPVAASAKVDVGFKLVAVRDNFGPKSLNFPLDEAATLPELIEVPGAFADTGQANDPVFLDVEVNTEGACAVVGQLNGAPDDIIAVSRYVSSWRFKPAMKDGKSIALRGHLTFLMGKAQEIKSFVPSVPGAFRAGGNVSRPRLVRQVQPSYSEEARKSGVSGTAVLRIVVGAYGSVMDAKVTRGLGFGLDEMAEKAVRQWTFDPGQKDGKPVPVIANVEVNFRLLLKRPDVGPNSLVFKLAAGVSRPRLLDVPARVPDDIPDADPVVLDVEVDTAGHCKVTGLVSGTPGTAALVTSVVERWRFEPAAINGNPIAAQGRVRYLLGKPENGPVKAPGAHSGFGDPAN